MPLGDKPECVKCNSKESVLWHSTGNGNLCNNCLESERKTTTTTTCNLDNVKIEEETAGGGSSKPSRKSTRITRFVQNNKSSLGVNKSTASIAQTVKNGTRGRGRRHIFKKNPVKAPRATATTVTSNFVFYKGSYFQVGDIVSMQDVDGGTYYAQIRGLLTDQYCEKSAAVTWLLPTTASPSPEEGFSPETYIIGPEEDLPRKLECMEFVMHAPSDYYKLKNTPYPPPVTEAGTGYLWTSFRHEVNNGKK